MAARFPDGTIDQRHDAVATEPAGASALQVFESQVDRDPSAVAIESGDRSVTYGQLDDHANRVGHRLHRAGITRDDRVAVAAHRSIEAIVAFLGVLKAGGAYVPLDPDDPRARLELMIRDTGARVVLVQERFADRVQGLGAESVPLDPGLDNVAAEDSARTTPRAGPDDLAYVMYTSGSTGRPKGVAIPHRGVVRRVQGAHGLMPHPGDGMLQVSELDFDAQTWEIWGALLNSARLVIVPPGRPEPGVVGRVVSDHGVTVALLSPGLFHQMAEGSIAALGGLRLLLVGGDILSPTHANRFVETHPTCPLVNLFGPTEVTVCCSWHEVHGVPSGESVPIGRPLGNTHLYVLDEKRKPVPPDEPGELYIGGDCVARGYLNLPEASAERFLPDPFVGAPGAQMYRSGDRVRVRPDGELAFMGRIDDQVKIRGFRIEPAEIEAHLRTAPGVTNCAVVAREDVPGHRRLVAYVVPSSEARNGFEGLRDHLGARLPAHMIPSAFVALDHLPLTTRGKVDRAALPAPGDNHLEAEYRAPTTPLELELERVWADVLHLPRVGIDDDFLELGGDSLLALRLLVRLGETLGRQLPVDAVLREGTIRRLASRIESGLDETSELALPTLRQVTADRRVSVTPMQAQALFAGEIADDALPYQFQALIHFEGQLDVAALEFALSQLVHRHEILRTRFPKLDGTWWQMVEAPLAVELPVADLRSHEDRDAALARLAADAFRTRIPADQLPLARWTLARLADDHHVLVHVEHHLVHDGWSWAVFLRELIDLYRAQTEGGVVPAEPSIQFRDFATWQHELTESSLGRSQLAYWTHALADLPPPLDLPSDRPRPDRPTYRGDQLLLDLAPDLTDRLRAASRDQGITLFMTMLSAFLVLLRRYTGQDDIVVGSGVSNRRLRETEDLLGMVLNTVALRADLSGDPSLGELMERVRAVALEASAHQDVPFERVVDAVGPPRRAGYPPVYQVLFSFQDPLVPDLRLPGVTITPDDTPGNGSAKADLNVVVIHRRRADPHGSQAGELTLVWEYSTDLFDPGTAERMLDAYSALLDGITRDPSTRISELPALSGAERAHTIPDAGTSVPYPRGASIVDVFATCAQESPDAVALVADGVELSYDELDRRANRLAHRLIAMGVAPGTPVGVLLERSPDSIVALLAILKAGGAYVALDPSFPNERLLMMLDDTRAPIVCTDSRLRDRLPTGGPAALCLDEVDLANNRDDAPRIPIAGSDLAYVAYTSGSTGVPKGVEVPHRAVVRLVRGVDYVDLSGRETLLAMAPLAFDASTFEIWGALLNGARLAIAPSVPLSPTDIAEVVERFRVTTLWLTAGMFHLFVDRCPDGVRHVRQLVAGGDVLSPAHVDRALRLLPDDGALVNGYGPTEATTFTCCHRMPAGSRISGPVPIGHPIGNTRVHLLDERCEPVPVGAVGELYIGGDGVARGYLGQPELTAERFVPDPFDPDPGARLYRSGDLGRRRRDGVTEFLGRVDRQVKIRGFRVEPDAVEHTLLRHPDVRDAAVVARTYAADDKRLVAYVTPVDVDVESLRTFLAQRLPPHELPSAWVTIERLPLTDNGKVDRDCLPEPSVEPRDARATRPATRLKRKLITIWEETLGVHPIGLHDDFFDLGGHSLLAVDLFATIQRRIGPRLPLATIFEAPTVDQLAAVVRREGWEAPWSSLVTLNAAGSRPPFFCVTAGDGNTVGYGALSRHLRADQPLYALQPRGLDGHRPLQADVEAMARHYLRAVRTVQERGPFLLGGRCLGGLVAYEMARLLERAGEEVALLVVLDSLGPHWAPRRLANGMLFDEIMNLALVRARAEGEEFRDVFEEPGTTAFVDWLREPAVAAGDLVVNRYLFEAYLARPDVQAAYPDLRGGDLARLLDWGWVSGRGEMGMSEELLPPSTPAAAALRPPRTSRLGGLVARIATRSGDWVDVACRGRLAKMAARRERRLQAIAHTAAAAYRAQSYGGRVTLVRSREFLGDIEIARWHGVETAGVDEVIAGGTHRSMLREPDVVSLAECLEECFDAAVGDAWRLRI